MANISLAPSGPNPRLAQVSEMQLSKQQAARKTPAKDKQKRGGPTTSAELWHCAIGGCRKMYNSWNGLKSVLSSSAVTLVAAALCHASSAIAVARSVLTPPPFLLRCTLCALAA